MRIPNLNISQSITNQLRDLDLQRLKLNDQISSGQKITRASDDGLSMGRVIQLDSQKSKLSQYQRNASYATEYLNAGQMNLDKLREINQRAQEISRLAGSNLNGSGIGVYAKEIDQLIEEALNRLNSSQRGRALFGGNELSPDFSHSKIISENRAQKVINFNSSTLGVEAVPGKRYLKQGDQVAFRANGREFVVEAKTNDVKEFDEELSYNKGDIVKVTSVSEDSIRVNPNLFAAESTEEILPLMQRVLDKLSQRDWSTQPVGTLQNGEGSVYQLDAAQIEEIALSLGNQPFIEFFPDSAGYYGIVELEDGSINLEPATDEIVSWHPGREYGQDEFVKWAGETYRSKSSILPGTDFTPEFWDVVDSDSEENLFSLTRNENEIYWQAQNGSSVNSGLPASTSNQWVQVDPKTIPSLVSSEDLTLLMRDLINSGSFLLNESKIFESENYYAFVRPSGDASDSTNENLELNAKINTSGGLEVTGTVGVEFDAKAFYVSHLDSDNYYPNQLDKILHQKAELMFPHIDYVDLNENDKNLVWSAVKESTLSWDLTVSETSTNSGSDLKIKLSSPWKRLEVYQIGDVVDYNGRLWESVRSENFNHTPNETKLEFWKEVGNGYDQSREDWEIKSTGVETRYYFSAPDGRLFDDQAQAESYTYELLLNSNKTYDSLDALWSDIDNLVKEVGYPVSQFEAVGSNSEGKVYFDSASQSYRLTTLAKGESPVDGSFLKGGLKSSLDQEVESGDVVGFKGLYYLVLEANLDKEEVSKVAERKEFFEAKDGNLESSTTVGDKFYDDSVGRIYMRLGDQLPSEGNEKVLHKDIGQSLREGSYFYDRNTASFYVATKDISNATDSYITSDESYAVRVNSSSYTQGSEWSAGQKYFKGQIVLHQGVYYENQTNGVRGPNGEILGFDNRDDDELVNGAELIHPIVSPTDDFFLDVEDAKSLETINLLRARGEAINNNVWLPVTKTLQHVFAFDVDNHDSAIVEIESSGQRGKDADVSIMTDVNGQISGLRVDDPGRYFFPTESTTSTSFTIPENYKEAEVFLSNGASIKANIIWGQNPNDPGAFNIVGFELMDSVQAVQTMGAKKGDKFSFSTGKKTFLDHRDDKGELIGVTYTGAHDNSEFTVGKDTKVSSFLNAEGNGTAELSETISSLIELRDGLAQENLAELSQRVQLAEKQLIGHEDLLVDKIGEISSVMTRIQTVKAHDEEYYLELDRRLSTELDVDLSEAIMRLTRASTAYQAAMQVGAQLLNTSLLNYL